MIFINFTPGAMGCLIIKTIHHAWPGHFQYSAPRLSGSHNHEYHPDVFFNSHDEVDPRGLNWVIENQGKPGLVLMHNIDLLPKRLIDGNEIYTVYCDIEGEARASFLSFIKNIEFHMHYISNNFTQVSEGTWAELFRYTKHYRPPQFGKIIKFSEMHSVDALDEILYSVQNQYGFSSPAQINTAWYSDNYKRGIATITENSSLYQIWRSCFLELKKLHFETVPDCKDTLSVGLMHKWEQFSNSCESTWKQQFCTVN